MKQQVFVIHGGNTAESYEEYLENLRAKEANLERLLSKDWKQFLQVRLGDRYVVYQPSMPNGSYAKYLEWKIWFEKFIPLMDDGVILVGHSLGGIFLAKFLAEEIVARKIRATFFVAAPFNQGEQPMADFILPGSFSKLEAQGGELFFYHSTDDVVVPFREVQEYQKRLPNAHVRTFQDRGHFIEEDFAEIVDEIKSLALRTA